jgi:hypothetical protein
MHVGAKRASIGQVSIPMPMHKPMHARRRNNAPKAPEAIWGRRESAIPEDDDDDYVSSQVASLAQ